MFAALNKFGRLGAPSGRSLDAQIAALFSDGVIYDPSDFSTLYQDSAGTTAVIALEQSVGLMLDKSKGLVLGPELVTNGDFSNGTTGWATGTNASMTLISGELSITSPGSMIATVNNAVYTNVIGHFAGKRYQISFDATYVSGADLQAGVSNAPGGTISASENGGVKKRYTTAVSEYSAAGSRSICFASASASTATWKIDNISVRELPGAHATNIPGDTTTRPVTKTGALLNFDGANDGMVSSTGGGATSGFAFITAIKLQGGSKTQTVFSDAGTNAGFRVRINSSNQLELSAGNGSTFVSAATTDTLSVGTTAVIAAWHDGTNLNVQVNNGTVAQQSLAAATAGTAGFTLGRDNGAASSFMQAQTSAMLYAKKVLTASQIAVAKRYCAQKAGVSF